MTKSQKTVLLLGSFLIIGIGALVFQFYRSVTGTFDAGSPLIGSLDNLTGLIITTGSSELVLEKKDSVWRIIRPLDEQAGKEKISQIMTLLKEAVVLAPISDNPAKQHLFGVDSTGNLLTLISGSEKKLWRVGLPGPDFSSTYLRQEGETDVFIFSGRLGQIMTDVADYRDKLILQETTDSLSAIKITSLTEEFAMVRDSTGWLLDGMRVDQEKMNPVLSTLNRLDADFIADTLNAENLVYPLTLTVVIQKGKAQKEIRFYKIPERTEYAAVVSGRKTVYLLADWKTDRLNKSRNYWTGKSE